MKHWKPRAVAIVILIAALLTGALRAVNDEGTGRAQGEDVFGGAATALSRLVATLTGGRIPAEEAATEPSPLPGDADAPASPRGVTIGIGSGDAPDAPEEARAVNVEPNQRIERDYHVENKGAADAFVFMTVTLPYVVIATQEDDGAYHPAAARPLYTFEVNAGWTLLEDSVDGDRVTYVYAWADGLGPDAMTPLAPGSATAPLFDRLVTANYVEGRLDGVETEISVQACAVQAENLGQGNTPAAVWQMVRNQGQ